MAVSNILIEREQMTMASYKVIEVNLANAVRDRDHGNPLSSRLDAILRNVNDYKPDILVLLEWGRWSEMTEVSAIQQVADVVGLSFYTANRANGTAMTLGKAVFYRPSTIWIQSAATTMISTAGWGSDVLTIRVAPVENSKIRAVNGEILATAIDIVHAPPGLPALRKIFYDRLLQKVGESQDNPHIKKVEDYFTGPALREEHAPSTGMSPIMIGDFNTYDDCPVAQEFVQSFAIEMSELLPARSTFIAYPYDIVSISIDKYNPLIHIGYVLERSAETVTYTPESRLDHVFVKRSFLENARFVHDSTNVNARLFDWDPTYFTGLAPSDHKIVEVVISC